MKLSDLNEAKGRSAEQKTALRVLKDFDKFIFNGFKMIRSNGALTKSLLPVFKDNPSIDVEGILDDIDESLQTVKKDINGLGDLIKFGG